MNSILPHVNYENVIAEFLFIYLFEYFYDAILTLLVRELHWDRNIFFLIELITWLTRMVIQDQIMYVLT